MVQEEYPPSDVDSLLSKDKVTEDDLLQLPELLLEKQRNSPSRTLLNHQSNLSFTPTEKSTTAPNDTPSKRKSTIPSRQPFHRQRRTKKLRLNIASLKTHSSTLN